ncbi:MAG: non-hydrolyzing UDP-N-acetylglucosamine 2-epimerase [Bacteroidales bacterium]
MIKIVTVIGARPQFIKAAPVSKAINDTDGLAEYLVHTGQHFDENMSQVFFHQMGIPKPDKHLNIHSMSHGAMTGRMMEGIEKILLKEQPDWVMVYGDTNSTLAGALAAVKMHIPVAHVEAGLRSFNMEMPEEINRILTDRISRLLFCPTQIAEENLRKEGFEDFPCHIMTTGDVMYDAVLFFREKAIAPKGIRIPEDFVLATVHRQENTDNPDNLHSIIDALNEISSRVPVVFPVHPRTARILGENRGMLSENVLTTPPLGYLEIIYMLDHCRMVLTDSGGLQKEAYMFHKPCITLREETEWTELVNLGCNILAGSDISRIREAFTYYMGHRANFKDGLYGKGNASTLIAEAFRDIR